MPRHYLYLTNTRLVSMTAARGAIASRREYDVSEAGVAEFDRQLASMASMPIRLVTDLAEEDFRADTIPHVGGGDREAIVGRKLGQIYRTTPFRHALVMGRESEGRRDDRVVYMAITNPDEVKVWLDVIERHEAPLAGIHSAAVLGTRVVEALALASRPHVLLVHFSPGGALRQSYFRAGELRFTRLTPVASELVKPPRVGESPVALECRLYREIELGNSAFVVGEMLRAHVAEDVLTNGLVDIAKLRPVGRLGGDGYSIVRDVFHLPRPRDTPPRKTTTS